MYWFLNGVYDVHSSRTTLVVSGSYLLSWLIKITLFVIISNRFLMINDSYLQAMSHV